jgi:hypothetical protein
MRAFLLLIAAAGLSAEAPPAAELQRYDQALSAFQFDAARKIVDTLIHQRVPSDGKPRPDPLLNAMIGRLYLIAHQPDEAGGYLDQAPIAELPASMRAAAALDHARTLELRGDSAAAIQAFREAAATADNDDQRRRAAIGIARDILPQDPAAARADLLPIANGAAEPRRWEARYLLALASSLLGDSASARQWADGAWVDAATAALPDFAPIRVEVLRAGLAAAAGDVAAERAMLTGANGLDATATSSLSTQLPLCGDSGLNPSDFVIFGFASGPLKFRELVPIAASRPAAVLPFEDALTSTSPINLGNGDTPVGTVFTVRCRTVISPFFMSKRPSADPLTEWAVANGLYLASVFDESDDKHLAAVQRWVDTLSTRFGPDSPLLILPRWQLLTILQERSFAGESVLRGEVTALRTEVAAGLRRAGAPGWLASSVEAPVRFEQLTNSAGSSGGGTQVEELFKKQLAEMPVGFSRAALVTTLESFQGEWPATAARLVLELNSNGPAPASTRDRQAWQFMVAEARRSLGQDVQARANLLAAGIPPDVCAANDSQPKLIEQHFSYEDYPSELIAGGQEGAVLLEFGLSPGGTPTNPRILYSLPSGLFDQVSENGLGGLQYKGPTRSGVAVSCRGITQPVRWQLQDSSVFSPPSLTGSSVGPVF